MYGLINQAIKDLVVNQFGELKWHKICLECRVSTRDFVSMEFYADSITDDLVQASSRELGITRDVVLKEFGKYWVLYTLKEGYGSLMDMFGTDLKTCLQNFNGLHARMGMTLPQLTPPNFKITELGSDVYDIEYSSKQATFTPMVTGCLEGLAQKFQTKVKIEYSRREDVNHFLVTVVK